MATDSTIAVLADLESVAESALLHEAMGRRGALTHEIKPVYQGAKMIGRALTIRCVPGDNLMLHLALSVARPGDVLVATMDNFLDSGGWGEIASLAAQLRGVRGLVLDGSVRDVDAIAHLNFPVFSRGISIKGTTKCQKGELNVPITIGGVEVHPGDFVVGDSDGVVVVPAAEVEEIIAKASALRKKEDSFKERLKLGASTLDLLNLRSVLQELGFEQTPREANRSIDSAPVPDGSDSPPNHRERDLAQPKRHLA